MNSNKNILSVIVPVYNEEKNLPDFLSQVTKYCFDRRYALIFINDGSKDGTSRILNKFNEFENIQIVHHKINKGYGAAIKTGIENAETEYCITVDGDGQHSLEDVEKLYNKIFETNADMIVGSRKGNKIDTYFRKFGKFLIRTTAKVLMPLKIYDINSGMKIYRTEIAKKYLHLCPDTMAFSDIICLVFVNNKFLVLEEPITIKKRDKGKSTIGINDAIQTFYEIINIVMLFNPIKIFLPLSLLSLIFGTILGIRFYILYSGISTGSSFLLIAGLLILLLGLIAEQVSQIRKKR